MRVHVHMAAGDGEGVPIYEQFHPRCGSEVKLNENRRVAIGSPAVCFWLSTPLAQIAYSNAPIPRGLNFSVKVLQEGQRDVSPITRSSVYPAWIAHSRMSGPTSLKLELVPRASPSSTVVSYPDPPPLHFLYTDVIGRGGRGLVT